MLHDISHDTPAGSGSDGADSGDQLARQEAIKQIERKRRYWISTGLGALGMILLAVYLGDRRVPQRWRLADPGVQPELRNPKRVELLDHLSGDRVAVPHGGRWLGRSPAQADFGEPDQPRDRTPGRHPALTTEPRHPSRVQREYASSRHCGTCTRRCA